MAANAAGGDDEKSAPALDQSSANPK